MVEACAPYQLLGHGELLLPRAERPVSVQLWDRRRGAREWARCAESSPSSQSAAPSGRDGPYGGSAKRKLAVAVDLNDRSLVDRTW